VHIGAHEAQEAEAYSQFSLEPVFWVEAIPDLARRAAINLEGFPMQTVTQGALWSEAGLQLKFNVSSNDAGSSSFYDFHLHSASYPNVENTSILELETETLCGVLNSHFPQGHPFGYLVLDVQGAELEVLRGAGEALGSFTGVMTEVSIRELYKGAPLFEELTSWFRGQDFQLISCDISSETGWGDALFVKSFFVKKFGLEVLDYKDVRLLKKITFPTRVRIAMIRIGLNPRYFSRAIFARGNK